MSRFKSWTDFYTFSAQVQHRSRYGFTKDIQEFLNVLLSTAASRKIIVPQGTILWRAQLGCDTEDHYDETIDEVYEREIPFSIGRMKPIKYQGKEGRVNPQGISYLYLSTSDKTAMAELRPWVKELISLAQFKTMRDLNILDCSVNSGKTPLFLDEPSDDERTDAVWSCIDSAFSTPIIDRDQKSGAYTPTQIIADFFKQNGYDGIGYKSSLNKEGHNIVLFNLDSAAAINCTVHEVISANYEFRKRTETEQY